jgi:hypothetical protein
MAEGVTHQVSERSNEAQGRGLPFDPIYDTIGAEPAPETPPAAGRDSAGARPQPSANDFKFSAASERPELKYPTGFTIANTIIAVGTVMIAITVLYLGLQLRKQVWILGQQLQTSIEQARATQESKQLEQRSWVGVAEVVPQPLTATGGAFSISLQNSGKVPALDVNVSGFVLLQDSPQIRPVNDESGRVQRSAGILFPGAVHKIPIEFRISLPAVAALYRNQTYAVLYISVSYKDVSQARHTTKNCFYWQPMLREVQACQGYDSVN